MPTGTIELDQDSLSYGDTATFTCTVEGKQSPKAKVYVTVVCLQDGEAVYQKSGPPDSDFVLTDLAGLEWDGGPADGIAALIYRVDRREDIIVTLDQVTFEVS